MTGRGESWTIASCVVAGAVWLSAQSGEYPVLRPVDEASEQADFFSFRAHLQAAIARRDREAVLALIDTNIRNSFGDDHGRDAFRQYWRLESQDTPLWHELGITLALGGTFDANGAFVAPYTFSRWPGDVDAFEHVAIIGSGVRVRTEPRPDSDTLASLTYAIVPIVHDPGQPPDLGDRWTAVRLPNRRVGFVAAQYARSPIDYRAIFARVAGDWRMVAFVAGD